MKKLVYIIGLSSLLLVSCGTWADQMGYPHKVRLPKTGGEVTVTGDEPIFDFYLADEEGNQLASTYWGATDTLSLTFQWLTVKLPKSGATLVIKADPSPNKKDRTMNIIGEKGPAFMHIVVKQ